MGFRLCNSTVHAAVFFHAATRALDCVQQFAVHSRRRRRRWQVPSRHCFGWYVGRIDLRIKLLVGLLVCASFARHLLLNYKSLLAWAHLLSRRFPVWNDIYSFDIRTRLFTWSAIHSVPSIICFAANLNQSLCSGLSISYPLGCSILDLHAGKAGRQ